MGKSLLSTLSTLSLFYKGLSRYMVEGTQANANRTFKLSLSRSMSATPATPRRQTSSSVSSIDSLLSRLQLEQSRSTQLLVSAFEKRSKSLWESIESSIRLAEEEERVMEENRKKMEEAEKRARELRQAEIKREEEEEKRKQEEEEKTMREREEQRQRFEREKRELEEKEAERDKKTAVVRGKMTGEGSPKAEFEKWSKKMNVRFPISLSLYLHCQLQSLTRKVVV